MKCLAGHEMTETRNRLTTVDANGVAEVQEEVFYHCEECIQVLLPWCRCEEGCWVTPLELERLTEAMAARGML